MKIFRLIAATMFLAAIAAVPSFAQQRTGTSAAQPPAAPATGPAQAGAVVPASKIAFVNTAVFGDEKAGISRYIAAVKNLQVEFDPRQKELITLANRIKAIADDIGKTENVQDPKVTQGKREEGERLQRELKFKKEEAEAAFQKRYEQVVGPISADIGKALDVFARQRGITMILDVSKMGDAILTVDVGMDVTSAFITEYNSKNPTTASTAAPGR